MGGGAERWGGKGEQWGKGTASIHFSCGPSTVLLLPGKALRSGRKREAGRAHREGALDAQLGVNSSSSAQEHSFPDLCPLQSLHRDAGAWSCSASELEGRCWVGMSLGHLVWILCWREGLLMCVLKEQVNLTKFAVQVSLIILSMAGKPL